MSNIIKVFPVELDGDTIYIHPGDWDKYNRSINGRLMGNIAAEIDTNSATELKEFAKMLEALARNLSPLS